MLEFDGFLRYNCQLTTSKPVKIHDIKLVTNYTKQASTYMMGINVRGGFSPNNVSWKWNKERNQDGWWIGAVNAGLKVRLKGNNFRSPLVNAYYHFRRIHLPESWYNNNKGGVKLTKKSGAITCTAFSGQRTLSTNKSLGFNFDLFVTPFKKIDTNNHWKHRYLHPGQGITRKDLNVDYVLAQGANTVNIHHNREQNPTINYPYFDISFPILKKYVESAHKNNIKVKLYYTTRELTNNMPEFFAFHSLNGEIMCPGPGNNAKPLTNRGGPHPWLKQHLRENYIPAWKETLRGRYKGLLDLAVLTTPDLRLENFYLEGLAYTIKGAKIDGLYIDDTGLGRKGFQRIRRVMDKLRPESQIDMHSWSHCTKYAGYTPSAYYYMQNFPYYNKLWFGEGFTHDYANRSPDFWLVELSGIPFGLLGEMMYKGMPARGMIYGMTSRLGWMGNPKPIWKIMDEFGMKNSEMIGYWSKEFPIKISSSEVKATVYTKNNKALIAMSNWSKKAQSVTLNYDWKKLGIDPKTAYVTIMYKSIGGKIHHHGSPENILPQNMLNIQSIDKPFELKPNQGVIFIIKKLN